MWLQQVHTQLLMQHQPGWLAVSSVWGKQTAFACSTHPPNHFWAVQQRAKPTIWRCVCLIHSLFVSSSMQHTCLSLSVPAQQHTGRLHTRTPQLAAQCTPLQHNPPHACLFCMLCVRLLRVLSSGLSRTMTRCLCWRRLRTLWASACWASRCTASAQQQVRGLGAGLDVARGQTHANRCQHGSCSRGEGGGTQIELWVQFQQMPWFRTSDVCGLEQWSVAQL